VNDTSIFDYGSVQPSATTDRTFTVLWSEGKHRFICTDGHGNLGCKHEQSRSESTKKMEPCRHVLKHRNQQLRSRARYLETRHEWKSDTIWSSFEMVMERLMVSKNYEVSYICNLALALGYSHEKRQVRSDDVYEALDGKFESKGVMGIAFRQLKNRELLEFLYYAKSRTPSNHGAVVGVYKLTDQALRIVGGAYVGC